MTVRTDHRWTIPEPLVAHHALMDDGTSISIRRHGNPNGVRMVLSHANGLAADTYYPFWTLLRARFDLVVFDLRNHGWNAVGPVDTHSIETFVCDLTQVAKEIDRQFGRRQTYGVFHSVSALAAVMEACSGESSFDGLVLFDPFICPNGCDPRHKERLMKTMQGMVEAARRRKSTFESAEAFADRLRNAPAFDRLKPDVVDLIAYTTTRPALNSPKRCLRCPPEYEARIAEQGYGHAESVDIGTLSCPVKAIGSDPVVPYSHLPTVAMDEILALDYDFIPDTTHFLQLEEPEACVSAMMKLKDKDGTLLLAP